MIAVALQITYLLPWVLISAEKG